MNRANWFKLTSSGILLPQIEPVRRFWAMNTLVTPLNQWYANRLQMEDWDYTGKKEEVYSLMYVWKDAKEGEKYTLGRVANSKEGFEIYGGISINFDFLRQAQLRMGTRLVPHL